MSGNDGKIRRGGIFDYAGELQSNNDKDNSYFEELSFDDDVSVSCEETDSKPEPKKASPKPRRTVQETFSAPPADDSPALVGEKAGKILTAIVLCVGLAAQAIAIAAMLLGGIEVYGASLNPISAIDFVFKVFSISAGTVYLNLSRIATVAALIAMTVIGIKNLVKSIKSCTKFFKAETEKDRRENFGIVCSLTVNTLLKYYLLAMLCFILTGDGATGATIALAVIGAAFYLAVNVTTALMSKKAADLKNKTGVTALVFDLLRPIFFIAVYSMLVAFVLQPFGLNLSYGVQVVFRGNFGEGALGVVTAIYEYLFKDVLFITVTILLYKAMENAMFDLGIYQRYRSGKKDMRMLISICVAAALGFLLSALASGGSTITFETVLGWFSSLRYTFLPIILLLVAHILTSKDLFDMPGDAAKRSFTGDLA